MLVQNFPNRKSLGFATIYSILLLQTLKVSIMVSHFLSWHRMNAVPKQYIGVSYHFETLPGMMRTGSFVEVCWKIP